METEESNEHYVSFSLDSVHDDTGIEETIVSHEEICEQEIVLSDNINEVTDIEVNNDESQVTVEILTQNTEEGESDENTIVYPTAIYIKQENNLKYTSGDDESMAVEALRQLGGMYPNYEDKKVLCSSCKNPFTQSELKEHQANCKSKKEKHVCQTCGEKFERQIDLTNHLVCHQVDRPHACRTCGNLFRSKSNLQTHMVEVHHVEKPHKCTVCGAEFQRPSSLSNHSKIHNYVAGRALMKNLNNSNSIKIVEVDQETSAITAVQSLQNFDSPQVQWVQAYSIQNDQDKINTLQEFTVLPNGEVAQIEYVPQTNTNNQHYSLSINSDSLVKVENILNNESNNTNTFLELNTQENKGFSCSHCGVSFARQASLTLHEKTHVKNDWINPVECEYCDKQFQDANHLNNHQTTCLKKLMQNNKSEDGIINSKFGKHSCSECGKKFTTKQKMFRHQWIHRKKTHSCEVCGMQFEKQNELDEHRLADHPGDSPFTCNECGKSFVSRQGLWEHGRTHAGSPAHFQCDKCSKTFSSRQGYLIHHRTHTGERPYGCKFCWKAFRDGGTLRKHERIHTGERPHVCPICARAFNQKVVLREHVRWVHAASKNDDDSITGPPFNCPLCGSVNQDRDELCAHIVKHSDQMIADAKAKNLHISVKSKLQKKKVTKAIEKSKVTQSTVTSVAEQNQALLSIADPMDTSENQNTYILVKNEFNNAVCLKNLDKDGTFSPSADQNETYDLITIANPDKNNENVLTKESNEVHLIPFTTNGETIQFITTNKQSNTLHLISKQNENLPVLAIPNNQTNENYPTQIIQVNESKSSPQVNNNDSENDLLKSIIIKSETKMKPNFKAIKNEESNDESEEMVCGICGNDFDDKSVLMEHVKIHL